MAEQTSLETPLPSSERTDVLDTPKRWWYLLGLSLSVMVGGVSSVCIKQLLLPIQTSQLAPQNTTLVFTLVASVGAGAGLVASPLVGALSDRTGWRLGRRRSWIALGIITAVLGMLLMAASHTILLLVLGEICAQVGVDSVLAVTTAVIPDQIPQTQRPFISACAGMAPNVGGVIGLLLVAHLTDPGKVFEGYLLIAAVSLGCVLFFLLVLRDPPVASGEALPSMRLGSFLVSVVQPLRSRDFCLTFVSRCCAYLSFTILGSYLLFYARGVLHDSLPDAALHVANFQLLLTAVLLVGALLAGWLSQHLGHSKRFAIGGAGLMALGLGVIVVVPSWSALFLAAVLFGGGFGLFLGVDLALAVRVLPSPDARGKDLGLMYDAIYAPLILSPLIGGAVLSLGQNDFALLFALAAFSALLAALFLLPLRAGR
ncbi:MAG TPA: MFS transporter [Ktedonobacteraceae bacterium]|nr:MFS transporter [Ktedonobacteraceae bacterium]